MNHPKRRTTPAPRMIYEPQEKKNERTNERTHCLPVSPNRSHTARAMRFALTWCPLWCTPLCCRYIYLNGKKEIFSPNTWVWLPPWTEHGIDNTGKALPPTATQPRGLAFGAGSRCCNSLIRAVFLIAPSAF